MLARRSDHPPRAEFRHLALDSALGGMWIALIQFNLLPSVLIATMLSFDKIGVGGLRFVLRTTAVLVTTCIVTSAALGFAIDVETPYSVVVACVPFLVAYPLAISHAMYALSVRIAGQNKRLAELSSTDELTGLANRRQGFAAAEQVLARHRRHGGSAVLVVLDIDRFKEANDRYGHPAGDEIVRGVAGILRECSRATDIPVRHAGDEFMLILPDTDLQGAGEVAKRIRVQLAKATFEHAPGLHCTVSLGAAEAHSEMADVEDWVQQADAALYRAKAAGRDCLVNAPKVEVTVNRGRDAALEEAQRRSMSA
jgi:diguanylate cyclase